MIGPLGSQCAAVSQWSVDMHFDWSVTLQLLAGNKPVPAVNGKKMGRKQSDGTKVLTTNKHLEFFYQKTLLFDISSMNQGDLFGLDFGIINNLFLGALLSE